jgi:hypothetical protein
MPSVGSSSGRILDALASARDGELLLLTAGEQPAGAAEIVADIGEHLQHQRRDRALAVGPGVAAHEDVVANGELRDDLAALRHVAHAGARPLMSGKCRDIGTVEQDLACRVVGEAVDGFSMTIERGELRVLIGAQ